MSNRSQTHWFNTLLDDLERGTLLKNNDKLDKKFWLTLIKWAVPTFLVGYLIGFLLPNIVLSK